MSVDRNVLLDSFPELNRRLGAELFVQRDDLLPFPLAGNKVRKVAAELDQLAEKPDLIITNGAVDSNHCRTVAMMGARRGISVHLVLHGDTKAISHSTVAMMLDSLGATCDVVAPGEIALTIAKTESTALNEGKVVHIIAGGCHTPAGSMAYKEIGIRVFNEVLPDIVFLPSGTGATQGGLIAASKVADSQPRIVGISVARVAERGVAPVRHAAEWAGAIDPFVEFDDRFRAGGYGFADERVNEAVALGWRNGLPLDSTYTGKAFSGLISYARSGELKGKKVLFWHTGGLWNFLSRS